VEELGGEPTEPDPEGGRELVPTLELKLGVGKTVLIWLPDVDGPSGPEGDPATLELLLIPPEGETPGILCDKLG
jgi:hypothetical protein